MSQARRVSEPMTWNQICERFPDQWIVLVALDWTNDHEQPFRTALVAGHGAHREALQQAKPLLKLFDKIGPFFTGDAPVVIPALPPIVYVDFEIPEGVLTSPYTPKIGVELHEAISQHSEIRLSA